MKISKLKISILLALALFMFGAPRTNAFVCPIADPFACFDGIFVDYMPICTNGALVIVNVSVVPVVPLLFLMPYVPITPIVPVFKSWGPVPGASTKGNFLPGGVCLVPTPTGVVPVAVEGILVQIGTSAVPTPWFAPTLLL